MLGLSSPNNIVQLYQEKSIKKLLKNIMRWQKVVRAFVIPNGITRNWIASPQVSRRFRACLALPQASVKGLGLTNATTDVPCQVTRWFA